jgi:hypothetical protein
MRLILGANLTLLAWHQRSLLVRRSTIGVILSAERQT